MNDDPIAVLCSDDGIYFFCDNTCKCKWLSPIVAEENGIERGRDREPLRAN
ncbi:MAG: hypothetical protein JSU72_10215 [Deltaproteobacteria bacterium]|nr:MAG: hypothetical protein JSU72_10215 [Deltaproteobacteria bacterium]